jgi:hypothetical protein
MRVTLDLDAELLARAEAQASMERITLKRIIEQALALRLRGKPTTKKKRPPLLSFPRLSRELEDSVPKWPIRPATN